MSAQIMVTVDDRALECSGECFLDSGDLQEYDESDTGLAYSGAAVTFNYVGTYVAVYGIVQPDEQSQLKCVLDGGSPVTYKAPVTNQTLYNVLYCEMTPTDSGSHTLVVTTTSDWDAVVKIDYVKYMPYSTATTTVTSSSLLPTDSLTNRHISITATATSSFLPTNNNVHSHQMNLGEIVGGAVGGTLLIAVPILLFFLHRRWRRWIILRDLMNAAVEPYGSSRTPPIVSHSKTLQNMTPASIPPPLPPSALSTNPVELPNGQDVQQGQGAAAPLPTQPDFYEDGGVLIQLEPDDVPPPVYSSNAIITPEL